MTYRSRAERGQRDRGRAQRQTVRGRAERGQRNREDINRQGRERTETSSGTQKTMNERKKPKK